MNCFHGHVILNVGTIFMLMPYPYVKILIENGISEKTHFQNNELTSIAFDFVSTHPRAFQLNCKQNKTKYRSTELSEGLPGVFNISQGRNSI